MITFVTCYYENGKMLDKHLDEWSSYASHVKDNFRAVIVDDCSQNDPAINHMHEVGFPVELYRILPPKIPWNTAGARNLGMKMAVDGFCILTDIDHMICKESAANLTKLSLVSGWAYTMRRRWADGRPLHPHPNSYVIERALYWQCGGTDEDFSRHWGAGEGAFRKILQQEAKTIWPLESVWLTHFGRDDIPDASTREWGRKGSAWDYNNNPELKAKARGPAYKPVNPLRFSWEKVEWRYRYFTISTSHDA